MLEVGGKVMSGDKEGEEGASVNRKKWGSGKKVVKVENNGNK